MYVLREIPRNRKMNVSVFQRAEQGKIFAFQENKIGIPKCHHFSQKFFFLFIVGTNLSFAPLCKSSSQNYVLVDVTLLPKFCLFIARVSKFVENRKYYFSIVYFFLLTSRTIYSF